MGSNFLAVGIGGALSGFTYTSLYGHFTNLDQPERVWYVLAAHVIVAIFVMIGFQKVAGGFKEREE
jgi:hypothetical protein